MKTRQTINGVLLLNKPLGISSNKALQKTKHCFNAKKAGHTGSLDPLATGMLPICFGEATKFSQYLLDSDKVYEVTGKLGQTTTTGDKEGEVLEQRSVKFNDDDLQAALKKFTGHIQQIPPMYSALKHKGQPLYKLARKGETVERKPREVTIISIDLIACENSELKLRVHCTKGTYIRTLIEDIGAELGCGAHVSQLHRTLVTPFEKESMISIEDLEKLSDEQRLEYLLPVDAPVSMLPKLFLDKDQIHLLQTGQPLQISLDEVELAGDEITILRLYSTKGDFLGLGHFDDAGIIIKRRLVANEG